MEPLNKPNTTTNRQTWLAIGFVITAAVLLAFEGDVIKNTISGETLFWYAGITGIVFGFLIWLLLSSRALVPSFNLVSALLIGCFLFFPSAASVINRSFFSSPLVSCSTYLIISKSKGGSRYTEYCAFVNVNGIKEKFTVSEQIYVTITVPGSVQLCTQKGVLGYEVVNEFKPIK